MDTRWHRDRLHLRRHRQRRPLSHHAERLRRDDRTRAHHQLTGAGRRSVGRARWCDRLYARTWRCFKGLAQDHHGRRAALHEGGERCGALARLGARCESRGLWDQSRGQDPPAGALRRRRFRSRGRRGSRCRTSRVVPARRSHCVRNAKRARWRMGHHPRRALHQSHQRATRRAGMVARRTHDRTGRAAGPRRRLQR